MIPPNIMWPEKGSGFEADPYSPAGTAQRSWWMMQRLGRSGRGSVSARVRLVVLVLFAVPLLAALAETISRLVTGG